MEQLTTNIIDFCTEHWLVLTLCAVIVVLAIGLNRQRKETARWKFNAEGWMASYDYFVRKALGETKNPKKKK